MKKSLLILAISAASFAIATPFTGNDAQSGAMGNTGVASATPQNAFQFNPALLADYPDQNDFSLTLPSVKFFLDDGYGLVNTVTTFNDEGTWDQFQAIDTGALTTAVFGDGGSEPSMTDVLGNIGTDISNVATAIAAIQSCLDSSNDPNCDGNNTGDLNNASASLTTNSGVLDTKVDTASTQSDLINSAVSGTLTSFTTFNDAPLQLGLGIDALNIALPSRKLGMAVSFSTSTTVGAQIQVSSEDFAPVQGMADDLSSITGLASDLSSAMNVLAARNQELSNHLSNQPTNTGDPNYPSEIQAWGDELEVRSAAVTAAQADVNTALTALTGYEGNFYDGNTGEFTTPSVGELTSSIEFVGANISEVGVSVARQVVIRGQEVAVGVTPKVQSINIFEKTIGLDNATSEQANFEADPLGYFMESTTNTFRANLDIGAAKTWDYYGRVRAGVALKDIIPWNLESKSGTELIIRPKLRVGAAHETRFTKVALDLDITENKPLKYGVPTRYLGIGGELNAFNWAALRAGYRTNLSLENSGVLSAGIGLTPFGTGLDISGWFKPSSEWSEMIQDAGATVQFSVNF